MYVAMTFGGALIEGPRNATTTISVQSRSFERHLCTFCKGFWLQRFLAAKVFGCKDFWLQIDHSAFFVKT
jgi:hypothetical protein